MVICIQQIAHGTHFSYNKILFCTEQRIHTKNNFCTQFLYKCGICFLCANYSASFVFGTLPLQYLAFRSTSFIFILFRYRASITVPNIHHHSQRLRSYLVDFMMVNIKQKFYYKNVSGSFHYEILDTVIDVRNDNERLERSRTKK